jgi:hypothetical protein
VSRLRRLVRPPRRVGRFAAPIAAATLAVLLASCAGYSGSRAHQVTQWAQGASLQSNDGLVAADVRGIASGIRLRELAATHTECDGLATDAATAYGELPTPDQKLTNDLNDAYLDYEHAAQDCSSARSFASTGFTRYRSEVATANAALAAAKHRMSVLGAS